MSQSAIDKLIINSPFEEPQQYWSYNREYRTFELKEGRRPAGYVIASEGSKSFDDPGVFVEIPLVNQIRPRVKAWREAGYPGVTGITKRLLEYWNAPEERDFRCFFFCQLEAIETVIWLVEAPGAEKVGIDIPSDGGNFTRLCCKMATGSGKTVVMALLIAWQILNKATYPQDTRFSKNIFIVAPGLTVKSRLQVLLPYGKGNYYDEFDVVPSGLRENLRQGKVLVRNWHALNWDTEEQIAKKRSVDKRGAKSDEAYVREVLGEMASARNIVVLNDEAHHAWRVPAESKVKGVKKEEIEEATKWVGGLDRIHTARGLLNCFDFSATPFAPSGKKAAREALFEWIVSDFGLNDAIESGLVKTPRVVIRDDGKLTKEYKSRFYHIYNDPDVKSDLTRRAEEREPLPSLLINAYDLLGKDWWVTAKKWRNSGHTIPPVMITVANRTETAARVKYAFDHKKTQIEALCDSERTVHIDSKVLEMAESQEEGFTIGGEPEQAESENAPEKKRTKKEAAELLRQTVDTVGKPGQPGEQVQNVISVGMLSEGWDAKTVTHIMGLRAFSSQLLCEQVVGRGLRRTSYDINRETGLFDAEYVNVFGVPFTFLPHESTEDTIPPPPPARTAIEPLKAKEAFEIRWPNLLRVEHVYHPTLTLNSKKVNPLRFNAYDVSLIADLAPILEGKPDITKVADIDLNKIASQLARMQKIIFRATVEVFDSTWEASEAFEFDRNPNVDAWVKNDHLGFEIHYIWQGVVKKYRPDFIIRLINGDHLILETKGMDTQRDKTKRKFLDEWVKAVNSHGCFGKWHWAVSFNPADVPGILENTMNR